VSSESGFFPSGRIEKNFKKKNLTSFLKNKKKKVFIK
jgi:hypothetical protein